MTRIQEGDTSATVADINAAVEEVIALISDMVRTIDEENRILAQGIPASLAGSNARKNELADQFEAWVARIKARQLLIDRADTDVRTRLLAGSKVLRDVMEENMERLRIAMEASRRRVEAVMSAIREQISANAPYGATGRLHNQSVHATSYGGVGRTV